MERADGFGCARQELAVLLGCDGVHHAAGELSHAWFSPFVLSAIPALDAPTAANLCKAEGKRCPPLPPAKFLGYGIRINKKLVFKHLTSAVVQEP